jgi:hypothetical protein
MFFRFTKKKNNTSTTKQQKTRSGYTYPPYRVEEAERQRLGALQREGAAVRKVPPRGRALPLPPLSLPPLLVVAPGGGASGGAGAGGACARGGAGHTALVSVLLLKQIG